MKQDISITKKQIKKMIQDNLPYPISYTVFRYFVLITEIKTVEDWKKEGVKPISYL
jgi:hypothetical protein